MLPPTSHHQPWSVATWPKFVTVPGLFHQVPDTARPMIVIWQGGMDGLVETVLLHYGYFCCFDLVFEHVAGLQQKSGDVLLVLFQLFQHIDLRFGLFIKSLNYMDMVLGNHSLTSCNAPKTHIFLAGPWGSVFVG